MKSRMYLEHDQWGNKLIQNKMGLKIGVEKRFCEKNVMPTAGVNLMSTVDITYD